MILHWILPTLLFIKESLKLSLVFLIRSMLVLELDFSVLDFGLHIHEFVESVENVGQRGVRFTFDVINFKTSFFNWLDVYKIIHDSSKDVIYLLLIFILSGNDNLLVKVVDTNDVANKGLQGSLKPVYPRTIGRDLNNGVIVDINACHVAIKIGESELVAGKLSIVPQEIISIRR